MRLHVEIMHAINYLSYQTKDDYVISHVAIPKISLLLHCVDRVSSTGKKEHGWKAVYNGYLKLEVGILVILTSSAT